MFGICLNVSKLFFGVCSYIVGHLNSRMIWEPGTMSCSAGRCVSEPGLSESSHEHNWLWAGATETTPTKHFEGYGICWTFKTIHVTSRSFAKPWLLCQHWVSSVQFFRVIFCVPSNVSFQCALQFARLCTVCLNKIFHMWQKPQMQHSCAFIDQKHWYLRHFFWSRRQR